MYKLLSTNQDIDGLFTDFGFEDVTEYERFADPTNNQRSSYQKPEQHLPLKR